MLSIFTLTLAANESREVAVTGEYFEIRNALFPIALIELMDRTGALISRLENPEQSDFVKPGLYETVRITNGATAQTVKYFFGSGDAGSRRTSGLVKVEGLVTVAGDVSVIDGGKNRSIAGQTFSGAQYVGAVAAALSTVQFFNPVGSGKNLIIERFITSSATAQMFRWGHLLGSVGGSVGGFTNKKAGGLDPLSVAYLNNVAGLPAGFRFLGQLNILASASVNYEIREPYVMPPGYGFVMQATTVNTDLNFTAEFLEDAI